MKITYKILVEKHACRAERRRFKRIFGDGGTVTLKKCLRAADAGLPIRWAAHNILSSGQRLAFSRFQLKVDRLVDMHMPYWPSDAFAFNEQTGPINMSNKQRPAYLKARTAAFERGYARAFYYALKIVPG